MRNEQSESQKAVQEAAAVCKPVQTGTSTILCEAFISERGNRENREHQSACATIEVSKTALTGLFKNDDAIPVRANKKKGLKSKKELREGVRRCLLFLYA